MLVAPGPVALELDQATFPPVLQPVSLSVHTGEHVALIGPNGAGKTTVLRLLAGLQPPGKGRVLLEGRNLATCSRRETARHIAYLAQDDEIDPSFIVRDYIALGRFPFTQDPVEDAHAITSATARCRIDRLLNRTIGSLSGGEKQRVMLARCLAQTPRVLLLDEPTNHLDLSARAELLGLLRILPLTVVAVLHDLALLPDFATRTILLDRGRITCDGPTEEVLSSTELSTAFRIRAHLVRLDDGNTSFVFRADQP